MRRWLRRLARGAAALLACCVMSVLAFDRLVARPHFAWVERAVVAAAPAERLPPAVLVDMLHRAYGRMVTGQVVRRAVLEGDAPGLSRMVTEWGVAPLLPLHFSSSQFDTALLASSYMGPGITGFAAASQRHLGAPLDRIDRAQAARLVAIAGSPSVMLNSPERLERRARRLLSRAP